ncbi:hypothetical protein [Arthrobacter woluwensis]|uniref:hypothetical protein n=1 Tax=Arthrobacter woluwensis TaxID=156980 RepID=UPI001AAF2AB6|nr:hypothetical protein [Arthrobacter woluwensis]QTF70608.1 hypothetical protein G8758_00210 [Arthrobacter woluwensis]
MPDLITAQDLESYPVDLTDKDDTVARLIGAASAQVQDAAGTPILQARSVVELVSSPGRVLELPGLPVTAVHSVTIDDVPVTDWRRVVAGIWRAAGWDDDGPVIVTVDYTHGLPEVPADIKDLVCRMVIAGLLAETPEELALQNGQVSSVAIDDYREAFNTGSSVPATEMDLPERTRQRLAARFGGGARVRSSR